MAGLSFRWIQALRQLSNAMWPGKRRVRPARRGLPLTVEPLEERLLLSQNAWLPQRLDPVGGSNQPGQALQLFRPATADLGNQLGLTSGNVTLAGNVSLVDQGSYDLSLQESGALGSGSFLFTEAGPVTFTLTQQGALDSLGNYSLTSVALTQTGQLSWSLVQTDASGAVLASQGGAQRVTVASLGTAVLDAVFAKGFTWLGPTQQLSQDNGLNLGSLSASSLTVTETGGAESYTFRVTSGHETLTGVGHQPLPGLLQSGVQSYNLTLSSAFTFTSQGGNTFTLFAQGSGSPGALALSCLAYAETGDPLAGPGLGYGFQLTEAGTLTQAGSGRDSSSQAASLGGVAPGQTTSRSFQFSNQLTYDYAEAGSGARYTLRQAGSYDSAGLHLGTVAYSAAGGGSYALHVSGTATTTGAFSTSQAAAALPGPGYLFRTASRAGSGTFTQTSTLSRSEAGQGTFQITDQGSYGNGSYGFTQAGLAESAAGTFAARQAEHYHDSGTGSFTQGGAGATQNLVVSGSYTEQTDASHSLVQAGVVSYSLVQAGAVSQGTYSLACYVHSAELSGTFASGTSSASVQTGTAVSRQSGTTPAAGVGYNSSASASTYGYASRSSSSSSAVGTLGQGTYQAGRFSHGSFALEQAEYGRTTSESWTLSGADDSLSSGTLSQTRQGTSQGSAGGVGGGAALSAGTYSQGSSATFASSYHDTYAQSGTATTTAKQAGTFGSLQYSFDTVVFQQSGTRTGVAQAAGADTYQTTGSSRTTSWSNQGRIGPYGPAGASTATGLGSFTSAAQGTFRQSSSDAWSQVTSTASASSLYEAGTYAGGNYNLSSVAYVQTASDSWASQQTAASTVAGSDRSSAAGLGTLVSGGAVPGGGDVTSGLGNGSYVQTGADVYTGASRSTVSQSGSDTSSQAERGTFGSSGFAFASVVWQQSGSQRSTAQLSGQSAAAGTTALAFTSAARQAETWATGTSSATGLGSWTQAGGQQSSGTATATVSQTATASATSSLYEAGSAGPGGYAFSSVAYRQSDSGASFSLDARQAQSSGTDSWSGSTLTSRGLASSGAQVGLGSSGTSSKGSFTDSYQQATATTVAQASTSSATLAEQGSYSNGSFAFSAWVYDSGGTQSGTNASSSSSSWVGAGTDASTASSSQTVRSPQGLNNVNTQTSLASSADSYTQTGSQAATQTQVYCTSFTLHEAGRYAQGSYSLASVAYASAASATQARQQTSTAADSGSFASVKAGTLTQGGLSGGSGSSSLSGGSSQATLTSYHAASGTYSDSAAGTSTQASSAASSLREVGAFSPAGGYRFRGLVYDARSGLTGTLHSVSSGSAVTVTSDSRSTTTAATALSSQVGSTLGGRWTSASSAGSTSYQAGSQHSSLTEVVASQQSQHEAGALAAGSYAFSSVALSSASSDSATFEQDSSSAGSGTAWTSSSHGCFGSGASVLSGRSAGTLSGGLATWVTSSKAGHAGATTFTQASTTTYAQTGSSSSSLSQRGTFAAGSYAFGSVVYQYGYTARSAYQQGSSGQYTGSQNDSASGGGAAGSFAAGGWYGVTTVTGAGQSAAWSTGSANQSGSDTSAAQDYQSSTYSLYEAGQSAGGRTSLASVVVHQASTETTTTTETTRNTRTGSSASAGSTSSGRTSAGTGSVTAGNGATQGASQSASGSFTQKSVATISQAAVSRSSLDEAGSADSRGVYSFSSVVFQTGQASQQTMQEFSTLSFSQATASASSQGGKTTWSAPAGPGYPGVSSQHSSTQAQAVSGSQEGLTTLTATDASAASSSYYAAGRYDGQANAWALGSVSYRAGSSDSFTLTRLSLTTQSSGVSNSQGRSQATLTSIAVPSGTATVLLASASAVSASQDLVQASLQTQTQTGSSRVQLAEQGRYAQGSFAFASLVYQADSASTAATQQQALSTATQTTTQAGSNVNKDPGYNLISGAADASLHTDTAGASTLTTVTTRLTGSSSASFTAGKTHLYEAGAVNGLGQFSLGCVVYDGSSLASYSQGQRQTTTTTQTGTAQGNQVGQLVPGLSNSTAVYSQATQVSTSRATATSQASGQDSSTVHEAGRYAGGSFALASTVFRDAAGSSQSMTAASHGTSTLQASGPGQTLYSTDSMSGSLLSAQAAQVQRYGAGRYAAGSWSLSSYGLTAASTQTLKQTQQALGTTQTDQPVRYVRWVETTLLGPLPTVTQFGGPGTGTTSLAQGTQQYQASHLREAGTYQGGTFQLGLVSFAAQGSFSASYRRTNHSQGPGPSNDSTSVRSGSQDQYTAGGQGCYAQGSLALTDFHYQGSATASYQLTEDGSAGTLPYSHNDSWTESDTLTEAGSYNPPGSSGGVSLGSGSNGSGSNGSGSNDSGSNGSGSSGTGSASLGSSSSGSLGSYGSTSLGSTGSTSLDSFSSGALGSYASSSLGSASSGGLGSYGSTSSGSYGSTSLGSYGSASLASAGSGGLGSAGSTSLGSNSLGGTGSGSTGSASLGCAKASLPGWHFTTYESTTSFAESGSDQVGPHSDSAQLQDQSSTLLGPGGSSSSTSVRGDFSRDGRSQYYGPGRIPSPSLVLPSLSLGCVPLTAPATAAAAAASALGLPGPLPTRAGGLALAVPLGSSAATPAGGVGLPPAPQQLPPLLAASLPQGPNGPWLTPPGASGLRTPNLTQAPWAFLGQLQTSLAKLVNTPVSDASAKLLTPPGPADFTAQGAFLARAAFLDAAIQGGLSYRVGQGIDFAAGLVDTVSFGLTARLRNLTPWGAVLVDTNSASYQQGVYTGQAVNVALTVFPPTQGLELALLGVQLAGQALNSLQAFASGDPAGGFLQLAGMALSVMHVVSSRCEAAATLSEGFSQAPAGPWAGFVQQSSGALADAGGVLGAMGVAFNARQGISQLGSGDLVGGLLTMLQAGADTYNVARYLSSACFTAEMLLDAEGDKKRADRIKVGDKLWSRSEFDPQGKLELKEVEEVFIRSAPVWNVHVAGQVLRTTAEHPFYVTGRGWVPARQLMVGDQLVTRAGLLVAVEGVADSGVVETVYNWRVADYHTYFVSTTGEGAALWAHNASCAVADTQQARDNYDAIFEKQAKFGKATSNDYRATFFAEHPELEGEVIVHHAVEQQTLERFPGVVTEAEIHSIENLRGIPREINSDVHLSQIRKAWNEFYRSTPSPTRQQFLDKATEIDRIFGSQFLPPV